MRDLQVCSLPSRDSIVFSGEHAFPLPQPWSPLPAANPEPAWIGEESWKIAEMTTQEVVCKIQPTLVADWKRQDIIEYVRRLIGFCTGCEVFPYGSVPLRTYLPDGDIDLTAFTVTNAEDGLVSDVVNLLRAEEHNQASHNKVKDVHSIDAEVKLVKCIVDDIIVDISFNQLGGLSTLCFLEQVDRVAGKDHLFKRSIILIKAWCYYESRILGAQHGLISTYGLETLVLYIFHWFHTSLEGPLGVLYMFLDYFSKFDWDNYCVSLKGPVCKSSLHDIVAEVPKKDMDDQLLSEEFLKSCRDTFSLSSSGLETNLQAFPLKHLNIIDPLKENNNLGRSVNRGNFYRIRSAFKYGARKLGSILLLPEERIAVELKKFFANTLAEHGNNCWKDVVDANKASGVKVSERLSYALHPKTFSAQKVFVEPAVPVGTQGTEVAHDLGNELERHLLKEVASRFVPEFDCRPDGDGRRPEASEVLDTRLASDPTGCPVVHRFLRTLIPVHSSQAPHSYAFEVQFGNGKGDKWSPTDEELAEYSTLTDKISLDCPLEFEDRHIVIKDLACPFINQADMEFTESTALDDVANVLKNVDHVEKDVAGIFVSYQTLKCLLNLRGDYKSHFRNLQYGKFCHAHAKSQSTLSSPLSPLSQSKKPLEPVHKSSAFTQHVNPQSNRYAVHTGSRCCHATSFNFPCAAFGEENKKRHGTGTYFPNMICRSYRNERIPGTRRNPAVKGHVPLQRHAWTNGLAAASPELSTSAECRHVVEYPVLGCGTSGSSSHHQSNLSVWESSHVNAFSCPSEKPKQGSPHSQKSCAAPLPESDDGTRPFWDSDQERVKVLAYRLKDEGDFPPLST